MKISDMVVSEKLVCVKASEKVQFFTIVYLS